MKNEFEITIASENTLTPSQKRSALAKARIEFRKMGWFAGVAFVYADGTLAIMTYPALNNSSHFIAHKFLRENGKWVKFYKAPNCEKYFDFRHLINSVN